MESITGWQVISLCGIALWISISSILNVTQNLRSFTQPWVSRLVISGTPIILKIQKYQHRHLDALFSGLSCVVSVPFYTAFLPLLFWTGHCKLARQMTLLMAFCDYVGNCIKDVVSAPRPSCPPVRRVTATKDEEENAMEYGLPSSHTLNTVCLSGYLLHYILDYNESNGVFIEVAGFAMVCLFVGLIGLGRIYLGMHSLVDIIGGLALGLGILAMWLSVSCLWHRSFRSFRSKCNAETKKSLTFGQFVMYPLIMNMLKVVSFWAALSFLLLFAYPTPELPTPSFEYHTAFNGVALGIVIGIHQTFHQFHHENVPRVFSPQLTFLAFVGRILLGIPTILLVKFCSKALAKWIIPIVANTLGIPVRSTSYIPALHGMPAYKKSDEIKQSGYLQKVFFFSKQTSFDVDTGIRLLQYAGLAWSVVDLVPSVFSHLGL
ncbi:UNVERIFIED_CONTAM: Lipid phosphate phosphatase delta [Sesamum calycinum]|uniref:Lipid phosphate phosphatase delta n=1 Tax=Sesamum calycinum TaxID=2727403 RepID=A0AAW2N4S4_9LAMI